MDEYWMNDIVNEAQLTAGLISEEEYLKKGTNTQLKLLRERVDLEFGDNPEHFFPE
ncbi:unnamed protein product, partial [Symbiodinium sp. KB8]